MTPLIFDRALLRRRRDRAAARLGDVAPVLAAAAELLLDRLDDTTRRFTRALEIGGRGVVAPMLRARGIADVVSLDLSPAMAARGAMAAAARLVLRARTVPARASPARAVRRAATAVMAGTLALAARFPAMVATAALPAAAARGALAAMAMLASPTATLPSR
jgi:hypothetical protein